MLDWPTAASLLDRLSRGESVGDLVYGLHRAAVEQSGASCSALLSGESSTGKWQLIPGFGLEPLSGDTWKASDAEAAALGAATQQAEAITISSLNRSMPGLANSLGSDLAVLIPLPLADGQTSVLALGFQAPPRPPALIREALGWVPLVLKLLVDRAALQRDFERHRDQRALLAWLSRSLGSTSSLDTMLDGFCDEIGRPLGAVRTSIWLHDRRLRLLALVASSDKPYRDASLAISTDDFSSPLAAILRSTHAAIIPPGRANSSGLSGSSVAVPLRGRRRALGVLVLELARDGAQVETRTGLDLLERADELGHELSIAIENVQLLQEVIRSHRELDNTFNSISDLVAVCDHQLRLVQVNRAFSDRLNVASEGLLDRPLSDFVSPATMDWIGSRESAGKTNAMPPGASFRVLEDHVLNGTFAITVTDRVTSEGEPAGTVVTIRDITQQARLEAERAALGDQLAQSEKLAALGQFVAGIAHELNNPLQGVLGHLELLIATAEISKAHKRDLRVAYREADRAASIVRNLLGFAGRHKLSRRRLNLNLVVSRAARLRLAACKAAGIDVVREFDRLPAISGDSLLLLQVFLNVIINAEQALASAGKGVITIRTFASAPSNDAVVVEIRDSGPGIPQDSLPRIFEPFYTTKEVGRGTGLGLAIVYGIVQEHGGQISAGNHPDGGAQFKIELPTDRKVIK